MLFLGLVPPAFAYVAIVNKTDHSEIHVVPVPRSAGSGQSGLVTVDGDLKDWDLSGSILMFMDESSKAVYSVQAAMMYDKDYLYIGGHVKDPTPLVNNYAFGGDYAMAWNADAIQLRFFANPDLKSTASLQSGGRMSEADQQYVNHITLWYSTLDKQAGYAASYTLHFKDPVLNPPGVTGAYKLDDAPSPGSGRAAGYSFEYRIPWSVLRAPRPLTAGDSVQTQWQIHWGNELGTAVRCGMTDLRNAASGDLGYMGPGSWGLAIFEMTGNLKLAEKTSAGRADGHIPIRFKLERDSKVSLAICDAQGRLIRTGLGAQPYSAGEQTYFWDGLDDSDKPVPAGTYKVKLLTHDGVKQKLVCDVGVSGTPPYQTEDGTGGWAGDYRVPQYVGIEDDHVILGTSSAEAAPAAIGTDLEGKKRYGTAVHGGAVTLHNGFGYFLSAGGGKVTKFGLEKGDLKPFSGGKPEVEVSTQQTNETKQAWGGRVWQMYALTVVGQQIVVSSYAENKLYLLDLASGAVQGEAELKAPFGLATAPDGTLYAVSSNAVGRYDLKSKTFTPIARDLDSPRQLACDADGNVYVSLQGKTMQVWKLKSAVGPSLVEGRGTPASGGPTAGTILQKFGKTGGRPLLGRFDPAGLLNPYGIAVDKNGRLWVAEADDIGFGYADAGPKRYSVWNPDGTLWKEFFGSLAYATTAYVDPAAPEYVYAQSVRYRVDFNQGTWAPDAIILRERTEEGVKFPVPSCHPGATFVNVKGRKFLLVGNNGLTIYEEVAGAFVPRLSSFRDAARKNQLWIDANNDGHVQPEEVQPLAAPRYQWTPVVDNALNLYQFTGTTWAAQGGTKTTKPYSLTRWDFLGFNDQGGLRYADPSNLTVVATDPAGGAVGCQAVGEDGSLYALVSGGSLERGARAQGSGHKVVKFSPGGQKLWEYQNVHCAFAWTSDAYTPGYLVGAMMIRRALPDLVAVTGYYGQYFLLDAKDGLFIDALGEDQRSVYKLDQHMVLTENFNGTLFRHPKTGKTYFLGGDADCRLWELTGLDTIRRQTLTVKVTPEMVAKAEAAAKQNFVAAQTAVGKKTATVVRLKNALGRAARPLAAADGSESRPYQGIGEAWAAVEPLAVCKEGKRTAQAQVGYDDTNLYVRFQVADESPFLNTPTDQRLLFKSGDSVEIDLATDLEKRPVRGQNQQQMRVGDVRIIIARTADGKLVATRYRYVIAGKAKPNAFSVETKSSGKDTLDDVTPWNDLPMNAKVEKDGYVMEAAIPWAALGVAPKSGVGLMGDVGVIYGNEGGNKNAIRYMWSDKSPEVSINNDIPSEIRIHPNQWGSWLLE